MKTLKIKWQRLLSDGKTCPRCGNTEKEVGKAFSLLKRALSPLGIKIVLKKEKLSIRKFKKAPLDSNQIWFNNKLLEDWIGATTGRSPCCDVCGPTNCRTIKIKSKTYETIPTEFILKAGLMAAADLITATQSMK